MRDISDIWLELSPVHSPSSSINSTQPVSEDTDTSSLWPDFPSPVQSSTPSIHPSQLEPGGFNSPLMTASSPVAMDEPELSDGPDTMKEDHMDVDIAETGNNEDKLTEQDRSCKSYTKYLCYHNRSDQF